MGRTRDIAAILGKTEITNAQNKRILSQGDDSFIDSAVINTLSSTSLLSYYSTLDSLPVTSLTAGDEAFVAANNRYYISNGSGWFGCEMIDSLG